MPLTPCATCGGLHDLLSLEPSFQRPDAYVAIPPSQRPRLTFGSKDACGIRSPNGRERHYYLRVLVPFKVFELESPVSWGVWAEVSEKDYHRAAELWNDPKQSQEPAFPGRLANALPGYENSLDITGFISLIDPTTIPKMRLASPEDHPFVVEQRTGVSSARLADWLAPMFHPKPTR